MRKSNIAVLHFICFTLCFIVVHSGFIPYIPKNRDPGDTCVLRQQCIRPANVSFDDSECPDVTKIKNPQIEYFAPTVITDPSGNAQKNLESACPFLDTSKPLCCNKD